MTWDQLRDVWAERDRRYRERRQLGTHRHVPLTDAEADAVRWFRRSECALLPAAARRAALEAHYRWIPPAPFR